MIRVQENVHANERSTLPWQSISRKWAGYLSRGEAFLMMVLGANETRWYTGSPYNGRESTVAESVAIGGGLRLNDLIAL